MKKNNLIDTKANLRGRIVPFKVQDILNYEIWTSICREGKTATRDTVCTIAKLLQLISAGYTIIPCKTSPKFCQQLLLLEYNYSYNYRISPTFIIEHKRRNYYGVSRQSTTVILGYCFNTPIRSKSLFEAISSNLNHNTFFNYEIKRYCSNDFIDNITNVTISNNIYVPIVGGDVGNVKE